MRCIALLWLVVASSCFAEVGGGYYPTVHQDITDTSGITTRADVNAWAVTLKLGVFLDRIFDTGLGVGWAPAGIDMVQPRAPQLAHAGQGHMVRADIELPYVLSHAAPWLHARLIGEYDLYRSTSVEVQGSSSYMRRDDAKGHRFFVGAGLGRAAKWTSEILAVGLQRNTLGSAAVEPMGGDPGAPAVSTSAWGVGASFTFAFDPPLRGIVSAFATSSSSHSSGGGGGGSSGESNSSGSSGDGGMIQTSPGACGPWICDSFHTCRRECPTGTQTR